MSANLHYTTLNKTSEHYNEIVSLIEQELGYSNQNHFDNDFLPLLDAKNWENCYVIFLEKELIGHIGIRPLKLNFKENYLSLGLIGGICIKKQHQGKGYFKKIFSQLLNDRKSEFDLFTLWTGEALGYLKFGFHEMGRMIQTGEYEFENLLRFHLKKLNELNHNEKKFITECYNSSFQNCFKPIRTQPDWETIFQISSIDVYFKKRANNYLSYFFINKGQDLSQIIHEIGASNLFEFNQLITDLQRFKLWLPESFAPQFPNSTFLFLGLFKIANLENFRMFYRKLEIEINASDEKEILDQFFKSSNVNFYLPGVDSI